MVEAIYVVDVFTDRLFGGNQAGVVILSGDYPLPEFMLSLAAEVKHSETVFVKRLSSSLFEARYVTPTAEVDFCGHATIGAFILLYRLGEISLGDYICRNRLGEEYVITINDRGVFISMCGVEVVRELTCEEMTLLNNCLNIDGGSATIVRAGLADILLSVDSGTILNSIEVDMDKLSSLSQKLGVVGLHIYAPSDRVEVDYECRNFAPLYGIDEESATGTSNAGVTYLIKPSEPLRILQGEKMGRPSIIDTEYINGVIKVGGKAVVSLKCNLFC